MYGNDFVSRLKRVRESKNILMDENAGIELSEKGISEFMLLSLIKNRLELSIYPQYGIFYFKKNFYEGIEHGVELSLSDKSSAELLIKEISEKPHHKIYYDKRLVRCISERSYSGKKLRLIIIKDLSDEGHWRGIVLPSLYGGICHWDNRCDKKFIDLFLGSKIKAAIFGTLKFASNGLVEDDEIEQFILMGLQAALTEGRFIGVLFIYLVLIFSFSLMNELKTVEKYSRKIESRLSLDQPISHDSYYTLGYTCGAEDMCFSLIEIRDFISRLTFIEKMVLDLRYRMIDWKMVKDIGPNFRKIITDNTEILKQKAIEYFDKDYIYSILRFE